MFTTKAILFFVYVGCLFFALQVNAKSDIIEPKLRMIDRSPGGAGGRRNKIAPSAPSRSAPHVGNPKLTGDVSLDFAETISFGVNTRGEMGPARAPLFCTCNVLAGLFDEEAQSNIQTRSYTAPELREHVPLLSVEDAKKSDHISFGVNARGEEGPQFHPTWCNCQVVANTARGFSPHGNENEDDEDEEEEEEENSNPRAAHAPMGRGNSRNPHQIQNIQTGEGVVQQQQNQEQKTVVNLQTSEGKSKKSEKSEKSEKAAKVESKVESKAEKKLETKTEKKIEKKAEKIEKKIEKKSENKNENENKTGKRHRRSYSVGTAQSSSKEIKATIASPVVQDQQKQRTVDYVFRGQHFSADGKPTFNPRKEVLEKSEKAHSQDTQILAELDEGKEETSKNLKTNNATSLLPLKINIEAEKVMNDESNLQSTIVQTNPDIRFVATHTTNVAQNTTVEKKIEEEKEDSENEDIVTVLKKMALAHPHASLVLSKALQAASLEQQKRISELQKEISEKDQKIHEIITENLQEEQHYKAEISNLTKMIETKLTILLSSSPSPSPSPTPSVTPFPSATSSPTPSSSLSPSPSAEPNVDVVATNREVHAKRHHHHLSRPKKNRKACYHKCSEEQCSTIFSQSLRQYAACMDECAAKCYES